MYRGQREETAEKGRYRVLNLPNWLSLAHPLFPLQQTFSGKDRPNQPSTHTPHPQWHGVLVIFAREGRTSCNVILCHVMLCYVMLCYVTLRYVTLRCVMLCYVMLCSVCAASLHTKSEACVLTYVEPCLLKITYHLFIFHDTYKARSANIYFSFIHSKL